MADAPVKEFRDKKVDEHPMQGMAIYKTQKRKSGGKIKNWTKIIEDSDQMVWAFDSGSEDTYNMVAKKRNSGLWTLRIEKVRDGLAVDGSQSIGDAPNKRQAKAKAVDKMRNLQTASRLENRAWIGL